MNDASKSAYLFANGWQSGPTPAGGYFYSNGTGAYDLESAVAIQQERDRIHALTDAGWTIVPSLSIETLLTDPGAHAVVNVTAAWEIQQEWNRLATLPPARGSNVEIDLPAVRQGLAVQLQRNRRLWHRTGEISPGYALALLHTKNTIARHTAAEICEALHEERWR